VAPHNSLVSVRFRHSAPFQSVPVGRGARLLISSFQVQILRLEPFISKRNGLPAGLQNCAARVQSSPSAPSCANQAVQVLVCKTR